MAELATYIGIEPRSGVNTNTVVSGTVITRGLRCTLNASGQLALAVIGVRGDYVAMTDIQPQESGMVASLSGGGKVPAFTIENVTVGDTAYSAAAGQWSKTATSAVIMGKWATTTALNTLGEVELEPVL